MLTLDAVVSYPFYQIFYFDPSKSGGATALPAPMVVKPLSVFSTKLMLTTAWRSTTTQCLHSFSFTLANKDIHSSLHCPAAVHCVGHHLCVAGDGSWTPCRQGCIQLLIYSYTKKYSFSKAGMVSFLCTVHTVSVLVSCHVIKKQENSFTRGLKSCMENG